MTGKYQAALTASDLFAWVQNIAHYYYSFQNSKIINFDTYKMNTFNDFDSTNYLIKEPVSC